MRFIDPHIHMASRTTDDYERMAAAGIVAVIEPAFWLGQPRTNVGSFIDYLSSIVGWERFRASQFGIRHYCTIGLNSKEANNEALAEAGDGRPAALPSQGRRGGGGRDRLRRSDRRRGQVLPGSAPARARVRDAGDGAHAAPRQEGRHDAQHGSGARDGHGAAAGWSSTTTTRRPCADVLDRGFWAAFTLYPNTKMGNERMVEIVRQYGSERIFVDSSADWGVSDPLAVPKTARLMLERGIAAKDVEATAMATRSPPTGRAARCWSRTGSMPEPSTSARCSRAIPCCAARSRASARCRRASKPSARWLFK